MERVSGILFYPEEEWLDIDRENKPHGKVLVSYVLPMTFIVPIAAFLGCSVTGTSYDELFIIIWAMVVPWAIVYFFAAITYMLAGFFGAQKDFNRAFALTAYACTPQFVGGVLYLIPTSLITYIYIYIFIFIYTFVLFSCGLRPMMKPPANKQVSYLVPIFLIAVVIIGLLIPLEWVLWVISR